MNVYVKVYSSPGITPDIKIYIQNNYFSNLIIERDNLVEVLKSDLVNSEVIFENNTFENIVSPSVFYIANLQGQKVSIRNISI